MLVKTIIMFCLILGLVHGKAVFVQESNIWQLDEDSFWRMALRLETHIIIELYSSESWCSKKYYLFSEFF
jgi:hypothetical protein